MKKILFFIMLLFSLHSFAQQDYESVITDTAYFYNPLEYLSQIDTSHISTKLLFDRIITDENYFDFNGYTRVKTTDFFHWRKLYYALKYSYNDTAAFPSIKILDTIANLMHQESWTIPIAVINCNFNKIRQEALTNGDFVQNGEYLEDINSSDSSYSTNRLISSCCLTSTTYGDQIRFVLPSYLYISNVSNEEIQKIEVDFGNKKGFQTVEFDEPIIVDYSSASQYEQCKMKIMFINSITSDTTYLYSHFSFFRIGSSTVPMPDPISRIDTTPRPKNTIFDKPNDFFLYYPSASYVVYEVCLNLPLFNINECISYNVADAATAKIEATFLLSDATKAEFPNIYNAKLRRPFIVCDGFDPGNKRNYFQNSTEDDPNMSRDGDRRGLYSLVNGDPSPWYKESPSAKLIKKLQDENYDIIIVNFLDGAGDIPTNAGTDGLRGFLNYLNTNYRDNKTEEIVLVGPSMGGIITRYALTSMEQANPPEEHFVKTWISFDSPHKGAYIPLGLQKSVEFLSEISTGGIFNISSLIEAKQKFADAKDMLNTTAAKQMLLVHYNGEQYHGFKTYDYISLYNQLDTKGFPVYSKNYGISNGGLSKLYANDASQIVKFEINVLPWTWVKAWGFHNNNGLYKIFQGSRLGVDASYSLSGQIAYENAPGGWYASMYSFNCHPQNQYNIADSDLQYTRATFMVSASTFGIPVTNANVHNLWTAYTGCSDNTSGKTKTPFDVVHGMLGANQEHVRISDTTGKYLIDTVLNPDLKTTQRPRVRDGNPINQVVKGKVAYNVKDTIIFGGDGNTITFENTSDVTVTAGKVIILKRGTTIKSDNKFVARIKPFVTNNTVHTPTTPINFSVNSVYLGNIFDCSKKVKSLIPNFDNSEIYPNPTTGKVYFNFKEQPTKIEICNINGKVLLTENNISSFIDISNFTNGFYLINVFYKKDVKTFKIMKL